MPIWHELERMEESMAKIITRVIIALVAALALASCGAAAAPQPAAPAGETGADTTTQTSEGGMVTVTATWTGRAAAPVFTVALNTHSVDLDTIDLRTLATLRVDGVTIPATSWDAPSGGHHRSGTLTFPTARADGTPTIGPQARTVELIIRDVAGVPARTFRWTANA